jgi:nitroreductase
MEDKYQVRYTAHQERKKKVLVEIMKQRHSNRMFSEIPVEQEKIDELIKVVNLCPSSCDRKAVDVQVISDRDKKSLLGGILVGGVGWIHRASHIILIQADPIAYKAGNEIDFMPYLDGGVVIQQLYLMASTLGLSCCFVNPNVREMNIEHYKRIFGDKILCGAFVVGYPYE